MELKKTPSSKCKFWPSITKLIEKKLNSKIKLTETLVQQLGYLWKLKIKTKDLIKNILKCGNTEVLTVKCKYSNNATQNRTVITQETSTCKYLYTV